MSKQSITDVRYAQERLRQAVRDRESQHLYDLGRELKKAGGRRLMKRAFATLYNRRDQSKVLSCWQDLIYSGWV